MHNTPIMRNVAPELERRPSCTFDTQVVYRDNRNIGRRDLQLCGIGDLYVPWYYYRDLGNHQTDTPRDIPNICLVVKVTHESYAPEELYPSCFREMGTYVAEELKASLKETGQQVAVDVIQHYGDDVPDALRFIDGTSIRRPHVFEGHHRLAMLRELNLPVRTRTYHLYDMTEPLAEEQLEEHYRRPQGDDLWVTYRDLADKSHRKPWFQLNAMNDPSVLGKYRVLQACFQFLCSLNLQIRAGIDIGCAEGAFTLLASKVLSIPMRGIDSEDTRILRAHLMRMYYNENTVDFRVQDWQDWDLIRYGQYDFALALSITHHMESPEKFVKRLAHMKAVILEVRIRDTNPSGPTQVPMWFQTRKEVLDMVAPYFQYKLINAADSELPDMDGREFYVLWKGYPDGYA